MKKLIFISFLFLTGCGIFKEPVPIVMTFPDSTPDLMKKCEELKTVEGDKVAMTDFLKTIVQNYTLYYQCSNKVDGWQEWYTNQKKIFDEVSK